ncbi:MAG TPA: HGxxPAAW family protein [Jiangellales bacterium]|nr:HGxxPAAW family protein [Jiangellales bacterium]
MAAQDPARSHGSSHGHTAAAWTAVTVMLIGFLVGAIAVVMLNWPLFWVGVAIVGSGVVVGKVMSMMGLGAPVTYTQPGAEERAEGRRAPDA